MAAGAVTSGDFNYSEFSMNIRRTTYRAAACRSGNLTLNVLAERAGGGSGRVYDITVTCTGASGLTAAGSVTVSVPHDQRS